MVIIKVEKHFSAEYESFHKLKSRRPLTFNTGASMGLLHQGWKGLTNSEGTLNN